MIGNASAASTTKMEMTTSNSNKVKPSSLRIGKMKSTANFTIRQECGNCNYDKINYKIQSGSPRETGFLAILSG